MDRWDGFFDDLEGRVEEQRRADELAGLADRVRRDRAGITLAARLAGVARSGVEAVGGRPGLGRAVRDLARDRRPVRAHDVTGVVNEGVLDRVGQDHLDLLVVPADLTVRAAEGRSRTTVPFSALAVVRQL